MEEYLSGIDPSNISIKIKRDSLPIDTDDINHIYRSHIYETEPNKKYDSAIPDGPYNEREAFLAALKIDAPIDKLKMYLKRFGVTGDVSKWRVE